MRWRMILTFLLASTLLLSGCKQNENDVYIGMQRNTIQDLKSGREMDYIYEFRGHSKHWAALYITYKPKGEENHTSRLFMKYIGKDPRPSGQLRYEYDTVGGGDGNGTLPSVDKIGNVYSLGSSGGNGSTANPDSSVKMQVWWNKTSETIQLDPIGTE
ncbi:hypothetical protein I8J29_31665 [Paenibacillus sp. MWE-103]|uniref:Lipoprotein n=1 Tax=Paenibacillus artemisiicola TaxID=1172618 RepID=A0ABS3WKA3_9BACL|nr:hypothetical protein [Paenibacillus artemisiicola]MBO7748737.1 hypothetical protein [Paenibacillus artemisiicola]